MPTIEEVREVLRQMTEEQKLELIRLCNIENSKSKENEYLLKLSNNHHCNSPTKFFQNVTLVFSVKQECKLKHQH